jgi:hypothetical protein
MAAAFIRLMRPLERLYALAAAGALALAIVADACRADGGWTDLALVFASPLFFAFATIALDLWCGLDDDPGVRAQHVASKEAVAPANSTPKSIKQAP